MAKASIDLEDHQKQTDSGHLWEGSSSGILKSVSSLERQRSYIVAIQGCDGHALANEGSESGGPVVKLLK